jgi:hypothetical protein
MNILILFLGTLSLSLAEDGRTKALMHTFVVEIHKMNPYLSSTKAFSSPAGKKVVAESLERLGQKTKNPPDALTKSPGFAINFALLADHVQKTQIIFDKGEMEYARMRVAGITNLCASCHMQNPVAKTGSPFAAFNSLADKVTFDNANFFFLIRRYDVALTQFEKLIRGYPSTDISSDQLSDAFRRRLAIYVRVLRNPNLGVDSLKEDLKNPKLPSDTRRNVMEWIAALEKLSTEPRKISELKTPELVAYVAKKLPFQANRKIPTSDPQLINMLYLSGLLYERLYQEPSGPNTQELLYYLAACERSLAPVIWYSISEIYLKECVVQFPHQPFSKKCFDAYEDGMRERFMGRNPPPHVRESIEALRDYL